MRLDPSLPINMTVDDSSSSKWANNNEIPPGTTEGFPRTFASNARLPTMGHSPTSHQTKAVPSRDPFQQGRDLGGLYVEVSNDNGMLTFTDNRKLTQSSIKQLISQPTLLSVFISALVQVETERYPIRLDQATQVSSHLCAAGVGVVSLRRAPSHFAYDCHIPVSELL